MKDLPFPRGVRDLLPNEALFRNKALRDVERVFQSFGFLTIDTPTFESLDLLRAKGSIGEDTKLLYEMKNENLGLRYDLTVSVARYYAMHKNLPLPFKRYYIGKSFRMDEPQKNRYREFTQADVDIIGGDYGYTDAEAIAAACKAYESLGVNYEIHINDRRFIDAMLRVFGIDPNLNIGVYRTIDKLDKRSPEEVSKMLLELGMSKEQVDNLMGVVTRAGTNNEKLEYLLGITKDEKDVNEFRMLLGLLDQYKLLGAVIVDFALVRGIDYYTSTVLEFKSADKDMKVSIGSGGRYDKLIGLYSGTVVAACGASIGIDRVLDLLDFGNSSEYTYAKVIVNYIKPDNYMYALGVANKLREAGIDTDINNAARNLANQLSYANSLKIKYAVIVGDAEQKMEKVKMRDLISGTESVISVDDAIQQLKKEG
ncbi:histidyl-tRNA synthetase [mine drainage metagenome]|uniref:histidine--tRNA ligase n=1 Tax=mine drainage metagenome TaxID=410659 RepID=T1A8C4_9ZZZZ